MPHASNIAAVLLVAVVVHGKEDAAYLLLV
jgi:hypothetical protein